MSTVLVVGLGAMGARMATRLLEAGHEIAVWNRTAQVAQDFAKSTGCSVVTDLESPGDVDFVVAMLTGDPASRAVWLDGKLLETLPTGAAVIECSTLTPEWTHELAGLFHARATPFAEAPIFGSLPQIQAGSATSLVGCAAEVYPAVAQVIGAFCGKVEHVGPVGAASTLKLCGNYLTAVQAAALSEITSIAAANGLDESLLTGIFAGMPMMSPQAARMLSRMSAADYQPNFPIRLLRKDLDYFAHIAPANQDFPLLASALHSFTQAIEQGLGDSDMTAINALDRASTPPREAGADSAQDQRAV